MRAYCTSSLPLLRSNTVMVTLLKLRAPRSSEKGKEARRMIFFSGISMINNLLWKLVSGRKKNRLFQKKCWPWSYFGHDFSLKSCGKGRGKREEEGSQDHHNRFGRPPPNNILRCFCGNRRYALPEEEHHPSYLPFFPECLCTFSEALPCWLANHNKFMTGK